MKSCRNRVRETSVVATTVPVSSTVIFTFSLTVTFNVSVTVTMTLTAFNCDQNHGNFNECGKVKVTESLVSLVSTGSW